MAKRVSVASVTADGNRLTWKFGSTEEPVATRTIDLAELPEAIRGRAMIHGIEQKGRDSYAGCGGDVQAAIGLFDKVADNLAAGLWTTKREGGSREEPIDLLAQALVVSAERLAEQGVIDEGAVPTVERARETLAEMSKEQRAAIRKTPEVSVALAEVKAKASKATSLVDILAGGGIDAASRVV